MSKYRTQQSKAAVLRSAERLVERPKSRALHHGHNLGQDPGLSACLDARLAQPYYNPIALTLALTLALNLALRTIRSKHLTLTLLALPYPHPNPKPRPSPSPALNPNQAVPQPRAVRAACRAPVGGAAARPYRGANDLAQRARTW